MFNFNFDWGAIADFNTNFNPVAFQQEVAALANIATVAAVNSPAVVSAPANVAPAPAAVQPVVQQVIQAVAPVIAPSVPAPIIAKLERIIPEEVVSNPQVVASPAGVTVPPAALNTIASSISTTFKNDAQKDAEIRTALQQVASTPTTSAPTTTTTAATVTTPAPTTAAVSTPKPEPVPAPAPVVDEQTKAAAMATQPTSTSPATSTAAVSATQVAYSGRGISNDPLMADGKPFTGNRNGIDYKDGVAVEATRADILQADREAAAAAESAARAKSNPLYNFQVRPEATQDDPNFIKYYSWIGGVNTGEWKLYQAPNTEENQLKYGGRATGGTTAATPGSAVGANQVVGPAPTGGTGATGGTGTAGGTGTTGGATGAAGTAGGATGTTGTTGGATGTAGTAGTTGTTTPLLAKDVFKSTLALYFGEAELNKGWMDELYNAVSKFYRTGTDIPTSLNMALIDSRKNPNLKAFTDRFSGIFALQDLRQAGKPVSVPTIAEYVAAQAGMAEVFNQAGLGDVATEQFTGELIGKGNSVSTVADKVAKVFQRIDMAPKEIKDTLNRYFPTVDRTTLAKTVLLGQKGVEQLQDELSKYEVLAAAEQQGIGALGARGIAGGLTEERAQQYARMGETYGSIMPKLAKVAQATPTVTKLSQISKVPDIGQAGVEKAVISGTAEELQKLQQLSDVEEARFMARSGRLASRNRATAGLL